MSRPLTPQGRVEWVVAVGRAVAPDVLCQPTPRGHRSTGSRRRFGFASHQRPEIGLESPNRLEVEQSVAFPVKPVTGDSEIAIAFQVYGSHQRLEHLPKHVTL
jgi:hypothetical protein